MRASFLFCVLVLCFHGYSSAQILPSGPQVLTFFSDLDDSEQPYAVYIPKNYDAARKYPLVVMLHGAGSNHRLALRRVFGKSNLEGENDVEASLYFPKWKDVEYIVAAPYARGTAGYQGFVEKDVLNMLEDVKKRFSIDEHRMYLTGLSMGGGGTLWIGLRHPDLWAAIATVCPAPPPGTDALASNALNMAVQFVHGDADPTVPVSISREWVARLKEVGVPVIEYRELPGVDHRSWAGAYENGRIFDWFSKFTRDPYPDRVWHTSHDLEHGKAYWVRFNEIIPGRIASVDARFSAVNKLNIETQNLKSFSLLITEHPKFSSTEPLIVTINGVQIKVPPRQMEFHFSFIENHEGLHTLWADRLIDRRSLSKKAGLEGPISDAFATRHVYVYGTADNPTPEVWRARLDTALKAAEWSAYRGEFLGRIRFYPRVIADRDLRQSDYEMANLILFGTSETNSVIDQYKDQLPMHLKPEFAMTHGLVYVFPNAHDHLMMINSGLPWWLARDNSGWRFLPEAQSALSSFKDFILFKSDRSVVAEGYFENDWKLPEEMSDVTRYLVLVPR